ncbi:hypothetical protein HYDPIDRAFT_107839, partial [Hydnomerulius pinastri MD-312]
MPLHIRKTVKRKVPHPGMPPPRPDPDKSGPIQILVPDTDTSGTTSSQPQSQSQSQPSHSGTEGTPPPQSGGVVAAPEEGRRREEADIPTHDPEAWKHPSFMSTSARVDKGKGKARAIDDDERETETPRVQVGKKRRRSHQPTPPVQKRAKVNKEESRTEEREARPGERKSSGGITGVLSQASAWLFGRGQSQSQTLDDPKHPPTHAPPV